MLLRLVFVVAALTTATRANGPAGGSSTTPKTSTSPCTVSALPKNVSTYSEAGFPFASSLLHIYDWMRPTCDGKVSSVTFGNAAINPAAGRFYLGVFLPLQLESAVTYYQLLDYIAVEAVQVEGDRVQTYQVPSNVTLRITTQNAIGVFYDKWDTPQDQLILPYRSVVDDTAKYFKTYVGFMSMVQLKSITQLRIGGELGARPSGRKPALAVTVMPFVETAANTTARLCKAPPSIANGAIVAAPSSSQHQSGTYMPGDFALYSCNAGFALGSSVYATCVQGAWQPIPVCLGSCGGNIPQIPLATVAMKSFGDQSRVGDVIHYTCNPGYTLAPGSQSKVICQTNRDKSFGWSEKPVCIPTKMNQQIAARQEETDIVTCPPPPEEITNGEVASKSFTDSAIPGDSVTYKCDSGFMLIGLEMFCRPDGSWSQLPACVSQQTSLYGAGISAKSAHQSAAFQLGATATPTNGGVTCGDPPKVTNARVARRSFVNRPSAWLDTVLYECITGFTMKTMSIVGCSQNGTWVGFPNLPSCELAPQYKRENVVSGTCGMAPEVPNARIGVFRVRNTTMPASQAQVTSTMVPFEFVQYECHPGFKIGTRFSVVTCNYATSQWSEKPRCVRKQLNASASTTTPNDKLATPASIPAEALAIDPSAVNTRGQITCGEVVEIDNGYVQSTTFPNRISVAGDRITYNCQQGYTLVGKATIVCDAIAAQWEPEPKCVTSCGEPPIVEGGRVILKDFHDGQSIAGSFAKYACEIGLTLQSSDTIVCGMDGQWNIIPVCKFGGSIATACPAPPAIANGTVVSRSYTSNRANWFDTVRYSCDPGFHPSVADPTITCSGDGTWTRPPFCIANPTCRGAPVVTNGYVYSSNFSNDLSEVGSYIRYRCRAGYRLMGIDLVFCNPNLQWSILPTCEIVYCDPPPKINNGQVYNRTYTEPRRPQDGDRVSYICNAGYHVEAGTATVVCLYDGTWTPEPNCVVDMPNAAATQTTCGLPLRLPHGSIQSASFDYSKGQKSSVGDNVVYLCDSQYVLIGPANVYCDDSGQWSTLPGCTLGCGTPPIVLNGRVDTKNFTETSCPGAYIRYTCNSGYTLNGDGLMTCGDDGLWYGNIPTCSSQQTKCSFIPTIQNGLEFSRSFTPGANAAAIGDYVTFICNPSYTMQGRRDVACLNDGTWSVLPQCLRDLPKSCGEPPRVLNAVVQSVSYSSRASAAGDTAIYSCTNGFSSAGNSVATCDQTGRWINVPSCSTSCGAAPSVPNGVIASSTFSDTRSTPGSAVRFTCADGFTLSGTAIVTCNDNGRWSATPTCQTLAAFCSGVPKVQNGHETSRTFTSLQALAGDRVTFACDSGFVVQGEAKVTCLDSGVWSSPPLCNVDWNKAQTCGEAPTKITNGKLERVSYTGRKSVPGDAAYYTCDNGYAIYGSNAAYCDKNNAWSTLPRCLITCGPAPPVEQGTIIWQNYTSTLPSTPTAAVRYSCNLGYGIRGTDMTICQNNGQWTTPPVCNSGVVSAPVSSNSQCPPAPAIINGGAVVTTYFGRQPITGDRITYACSGSYQLLGSETATCQADGTWTQLPSCGTGSRLCSKPPTIDNAYEQSRTYRTVSASPGDRVQYVCVDGFTGSSIMIVTCLPDGTWSGVPQCTRNAPVSRSCGSAPILASGRIVAQSFRAGQASSERDTVTYACNDGYQLTGYNTITCSTGGVWTVLPICTETRRTCGPPPSLANGRIVQQSCSSCGKGDTVTYACNDGFTMSGNPTINCDNIAYQWTVMPVCGSAPRSCGPIPSLQNGRLLSQSFQRGASSSPGDTLSFDCNSGYALSGSSIVTCDPTTSRWTALPICQQAGCGFAPYFANSAVVSQNFSGSNSIPGSSVRFQCNAGYSLRSGYDNFVFCGNNGLWTTGPVCDPSCGVPPTLMNGQIASRSFRAAQAQPGDSVTYSCNPGFTMVGNARISCSSDGSWTICPQCVAIVVQPTYCNDPPEIANGQIAQRNYGNDNRPSPGDSVSYSCNDGYVLSGQSKAYCENATLTFKPLPMCNLIQTCGNNPQLLNGRIMTTSFSTSLQGRPGDSITYACNSGYTMVSGTPTITCDNSLLWGALPICMIMCPQPPAIPNGKIIATNYSSNNKLLPASTVQYACVNATYILRGSTIITCTSQGRWTTAPLCISNTCGDAPVVENAKIVYSTFTGRASTQSDMVTYACDGGYVIVGNSQVYCDRMLQWSPAPSCQKSCGGPPAGVSANVAWRNFTGNASVPGSMIRYTCVDSQQMQGFAIQVCGENGAWSPSAPNCGPPASCGVPPTLDNGALVSQSFSTGKQSQIGDVLSYSCNRGYLLVGSPAVTCEPTSLQWETMPVCVVTCYAPIKIPNGIIDWWNFTDTASVVGSTVHYYCSSGYGIKGPDMVSCMPSGNWSTIPTCQNLTCGAPPQVPNGRISGTTFPNKTSQPGDMASYDCNTGYSLSGDETIQCDAGTQMWSTPPACVENPTCGPVPRITNGYAVRTNLVSGTTQRAGFLDSVSFACNTGYQIQGPAQVVCAGDPLAWSDLPTCKFVEPSCPDAPSITNGYIQSIQYADNSRPRRGDTVSYGCTSGYIISGSASISCDGSPLRWSRMPTCQVSCGYPPAVVYANYTADFQFDQSVQGSTVRYACGSGTFMTQGQATVTCNSGKWSTLPKCEVRTCGDPPLIHNGIVNSTSFQGQSSPGDRATYSCLSNYRLSGNATAVCDRQTLRWIGVPSCTIKPSCGDPPVVINGQILTTSFYPAVRSVIGDTATYACDQGYQMVGQSVATCDPKTLLWANVPTCQFVVSCGSPPSVNGARVVSGDYSNAVANTVVRYECTNGYILQGSATVTCGTDGQWTAIPQCTQPPQPTCPNPPQIEHAGEISRSFSNDVNARVQVGDYVIYQCNQGYNLVGRNRVVCLATGDWAVQLRCDGVDPVRSLPVQQTCGTPPSIQNGRPQTNAQSGYPGDTVYYYCNQGYVLSQGNGMVTCNSVGGAYRWSSPPTCVISCGPAPMVEGSIVVYSNFTGDQSVPYSTVHYQCQTDFTMRGSDTSFCQTNGEWSQAPICDQVTSVTCSDDHPDLVNGYTVTHSYRGRAAKVGDFVSISCDPGYQRFGDDVIVCLPSGSWSTMPKCLPTNDMGQPMTEGRAAPSSVTCGREPAVPGATISWRQNGASGSLSSQPGDWVEYVCVDPNSDISGSKRVTCQSNGRWTTSPTCVNRYPTRQISCGEVPAIANSVIIDKTFTRTAQVDDRITYGCSNGFALSGNADVRCTMSGWSLLPRCLKLSSSTAGVSCGSAPDVTNAVIQQSDFISASSRPGSRVVYRCVDGYMLSSTSTSTVTCRNNGQWTGSPQCVPISRNSLATEGCVKPPLVAHATIIYQSYDSNDKTTGIAYGSIVMYDCDDGYRTTTRFNFIQCTAYGNWTEAPVCAPTTQCGLPPTVANARYVSRTFTGAVGRATDRVFYNCMPGYELASQIYYVECGADGTWSVSPQCVRKMIACGPAPVVPQTRLVYKSFLTKAGLGDVAWYSCLMGYRLAAGSEVVTCQEDGQWSELPTCDASSGTCDAPPTLPTASIYYQSFSVGTRPAPGDYVRYQCDEGLRIDGDHDEVTCTIAGTWTDLPNCLQIISTEDPEMVHCSIPLSIKNGRITMATFDREVSKPAAGDYVMYSCDNGYVMESNDATSTCTVNATWSTPPKCIKGASSCGVPPLVSRGYISQAYKTPTIPGTEVSYACTNGNKLVGNNKITCQLSGRWTAVPRCEPAQESSGCGPVPDIANSVVLERNFAPAYSRIGSYATISCNPPYVLQGNSRIECLQNNEWSDVPTCVARDTTGISCGELPVVADATISFTTVPAGDRSIVGDLIWFQCNAGQQPSAYPGVRCTSSGRWSQLPTCVRGASPVCPPGINLVFVFDLNEVEGFSRESDLANIANFVDMLPLRWQAMVNEMSANGTLHHEALLGLGGVTMTGMARREYIWTALNVSSETRYNNQQWRGWVQKNLAQFKHAFKDDLMKLFRTSRNTVLTRLPFSNYNRIVYMTTTRRGSSLVEAGGEIDALKAEPWNARVFTLAIGPALSSQAQQTILREEIASDSSYFKYVSSTQDLRTDTLTQDKAFADFICA